MAQRKKPPRKAGAAQSSKPVASDKMGVFNAGVTTKDSAYLGRIVRAIADEPKHPRRNGVAMQAHHVISATAMHSSGLADKIKKFGYNINELENLVFLPCTLQGACYLGVQPHRGNHTAPADPNTYKNDEQPRSYHDMVEMRLKGLELGLTKDCPGYMGGAKEIAARHKVKAELDELSAKILRLIQNSPRQAPLTKISAHFQPGNLVGCAGTDSTTLHLSEHKCAVGRDHHKKQGPGQKVENITYISDNKYQLKVGH
jgi:hypothetical protein